MTKHKALSWIVYAGVIPTLLHLVGCETFLEVNSIRISGLIFQNNSSTRIYNVKLKVEKIREAVSCGYILAGSKCSTTFPLKTYQGNPITISWEQNGRSWTSGEFFVHIPKDLVPDKPAMAVVIIGNQGSVVAKLVQ